MPRNRKGKPVYHVAIIGAGLGGLAAAIGITRAGHKVTIIEQAKELGEIGAGIQIPPNSASILNRWGLLEQVKAVSVAPENFILRSYKDGAVLSTQNVNPYSADRFGAPYLHIHRAAYHSILWMEAKRLGVQLRLDCTVTSIDFYRPSIRILGRAEFRPDIILGADGLKSICREQLLGRLDPPHLTGDLAYRFLVPAVEMMKHEELRELAQNPQVNYWMGPGAHAVCYLLAGGGLYNIVLICPDNLPEMVNTQKADLEEMNDLFELWDPRLRKLLSLCQDTTKWRLMNSEEIRYWSHPSGNFVLLGDACHATLPYLAQGAAMAIEDGAVIGALMEKIQSKAQLKDILVIYERIRKDRTTRIVKGSTALQDIFHLDDGDRQQERDRQLLEEEPFEGYPNRWADPVFQPWLFGYNAFAEVDQAWEVYMKGRFPGTFGMWKSAKI